MVGEEEREGNLKDIEPMLLTDENRDKGEPQLNQNALRTYSRSLLCQFLAEDSDDNDVEEFDNRAQKLEYKHGYDQ